MGVRVVLSECIKNIVPFSGYASMKHSFTIDLVGYGRVLGLRVVRLRGQQLFLDV